MESIHQFLEEVTQELLYNIVYDHDESDEIDYHELSEIFEEKTGHRPMDFFGFGNETGQGWFDFIEGIPGLEGRENISIVSDQYSDYSDDDSDNEDSEDKHVYKIFNETDLYDLYSSVCDVTFSGEYDVCIATLSVYPSQTVKFYF